MSACDPRASVRCHEHRDDRPGPGDWLAYNRANWDERVPIHVDGRFYDLSGVVAGRETLTAFELAEVGDVRGKRLLHLQSHIGTETLGWAATAPSSPGWTSRDRRWRPRLRWRNGSA